VSVCLCVSVVEQSVNGLSAVSIDQQPVDIEREHTYVYVFVCIHHSLSVSLSASDYSRVHLVQVMKG